MTKEHLIEEVAGHVSQPIVEFQRERLQYWDEKIAEWGNNMKLERELMHSTIHYYDLQTKTFKPMRKADDGHYY